jgi:hypothetical protein
MTFLITTNRNPSRTPEHVKKKVVELLFVWTKELGDSESKILEAYDMLKRQGRNLPMLKNYS